MRYHVFISLSVIMTAALAAAALLHLPAAVIVCLAVADILSICLGYRSVAKPLSAIRSGIWLLREQDFSSRLRPTGQPDADMVVKMFNRMMATMKEERLKLTEQNLFLSRLIEVSPLGIAICDFDGRVIQTNSVYRRLLTPAVGEVIKSLADDETRVVRMASSQIYRCSRLWFMDSGFRRSFYIIEVLTDEIVSSEKKVFSSVVRIIGHEVNNTLAPVISVLDSLSEIQPAGSTAARAIDGCRESCHNLIDFVRGYSGIVKLPEPKPMPVDAALEIERLKPVVRTVAGDGVAVDFTLPSDPVELSLDMMQIERAIINIVKNAAESIADRPDGLITLRLDGRVLTITDNGRGITPAQSGRIFTPFFSTKNPDRGLGLMLVAEILRAHGATFSLTTDQATHLTTFRIEFQ